MKTLYTVIEKLVMLELLEKGKLPAFVNNVGYSQECCDLVFEVVSEGNDGLKSLFPCVHCKYEEFADALTERFPINWQTHMYLMLEVDEEDICSMDHSVLLELSRFNGAVDEEDSAYFELLTNSMNSGFKFGVEDDARAMYFAMNVSLDNVKGYMLLNPDFDPEDCEDVQMVTDVSAGDLERAIKSSVF